MICSSVLDMDDQMLDDYLQFCEKALLPREDRMPGKFSSAASAPTETKLNTSPSAKCYHDKFSLARELRFASHRY